MYVMATEECRAGICKLVGMGTYPMVQAMKQARSDPYLVSMLSPLPSIESAAKRQKIEHSKPEATPVDPKGAGKGKGKNKGKSPKPDDAAKKGKGAKKGDWGMPLDLRGLNRKDKNGHPLCFGYNLPNGCEEAAPGKACRKGLHVCAKCLQEHSYQGCNVKSE